MIETGAEAKGIKAGDRVLCSGSGGYAEHAVCDWGRVIPMPAGEPPTVKELSETSLDLRAALENLERQLIERALAKAGGNRTEAAALLGLNRTTLVEKLRKYAA